MNVTYRVIETETQQTVGYVSVPLSERHSFERESAPHYKQFTLEAVSDAKHASSSGSAVRKCFALLTRRWDLVESDAE